MRLKLIGWECSEQLSGTQLDEIASMNGFPRSHGPPFSVSDGSDSHSIHLTVASVTHIDRMGMLRAVGRYREHCFELRLLLDSQGSKSRIASMTAAPSAAI